MNRETHTVDDSLARRILDHGYAIWPNFLTTHHHAALHDAAQTLAAGPASHPYPKSTRVWDLYRYGSLFTDLLGDTRLTTVLTELLGPHHLLSDYSLNVVAPGQPIDAWHIDYPYNEMPTLVDGGVLGLQCVLALDGFNEQNGATQLIPNTHQPPQHPPLRTDRPEITFTCRPGALLILAAATWHRSGLNTSHGSRTAILLSFVERWIRPMNPPPEPGPWSTTDRQRILHGLQRPPETINGLPI